MQAQRASKIRWTGAAAGAIGVLVASGHLMAWATGFMVRVTAHTIIMKTNAALGLLLAGLALAFIAPPGTTDTRRYLARGCAAIALLIGLATFSEHVIGWNLGIDQLLATEPAGAAATASPNRMGPPASLSLALLAVALLLLARRDRPRARSDAAHQPLALAVAMLGLLSTTGYLYHANALYTLARFTGIAWPTALTLVLLAVGALCAKPEAGLMARVTANDAGGATVRALLGPTVLLPLVLGWFLLLVERLGWMDSAMGTAVIMLLFIVTFTALLLFAGGRVSAAAAAQQASEQALRQSEDFLSFALATARIGAWDLDLVDHTAHRSLEHDRIFGYDRLLPRWTYEIFLEHVVPEDREGVDRSFLTAVRTKGDWSFECRIARRDGETRWIWAAGRHRLDESGRARIAGVVQDIHERRLAEEALKRSEQQFRALVENVNAGVALIDEAGHFSLFNGQFLAMFGLPPDASIRNVNDQDWGAWQVFDERGHLLPVDEHPVRKAALTGIPVRDALVEVRLPAGGPSTWMLVSAEPIPGTKGRIERVICTYNDITARRHAEVALRSANERLQEADRRKDDFLAVLSHELRNPLAPVRSALYVLQRAAPGSEQAHRALLVMDRQVAQLSRLVDDLLDVTRINRGKFHLQREPLDLAGLVRRTAEDHRALFASRGLELVVEVGADELWIDGDAHRLAQAVGNLLHNSAKFTDPGGRATIRLITEDAPAAVAISVSDNGLGVNPDALQRLFEPFVQVDATMDRARGGLGLGLALVKSVAELHGGTVTARSEGIGKGAEFTIRLPLVPAAAVVAPGRLTAAPRPCRVLIIEDNADAAQSLKEALTLAGYEVELASNGADGIAKGRQFRPQIVLCDIGLPGMNGYEVAGALRKDEATAAAHLVALTGYAQPEDLVRAREAGFDLHIAKPPDPAKLQDALNALCDSR